MLEKYQATTTETLKGYKDIKFKDRREAGQ